MIEIALAALLTIQNTTTVCEPNAAGQVVCRTREQTQGPDMRCAGGDWLIAGCSHGAHREAREAREAAQRSAAARERTMGLLRTGDCQAAVNAALDTGDLRFATEVRAFCAAGTPAAPPPAPSTEISPSAE